MTKITSSQIIMKIAIIISLAEFIIMLLLAKIPFEVSGMQKAILDVMFLVILTSPAIYALVILPFKQERDRAIEQLVGMAYSDPLTGLPNRRVLLNCMEKALAECVRHNIHAALMLIDLDDFKSINDRYGHEAGDAVLVEFGKRLISGMRKEDVVSRVGGDEFVVLIKQLNDDEDKAKMEAQAFAEKIQQKLSEPLDFRGTAISVNTSFGIHMLGAETMKIEAAIRRADIAMYFAKKQGKGGITFYDSSMMKV